MEVVSGFIMGIFGSFHCLGMCGPIALAVPPRNDKKNFVAFDSIIYNIGRISTYTILGLLIGLIGTSINIAEYQRVISIATGIALLVVVFFPKYLKPEFMKLKFINIISSNFKILFGKVIGKKTLSSLFLLGILNGMLPCGLVYVALTASLATGSIQGSLLFMLFFGLGTIPMMASVFFLKSIVSVDIRRKLNRLIPVGIAIVAFLLILRGMSLGIPMISPVLPDNTSEKPKCCQHDM